MSKVFVAMLASLMLTNVAHGPAAAADAVTCHAWAATNGSDANDGSASRPWRSLGKLAAALGAGQTGCLPAGQVYEAVSGNGIAGTTKGTTTSPVTIRSGPGGRARIVGWIEVGASAHDLIFSSLDFVGTQVDGAGNPIAPKSNHINVFGDRISIVDSDVTNPFGICVYLGKIDAYRSDYVGDRADDVTISRNRVHGCGMSPKLVWTQQDSGVHGIYIANTLNAKVVENLVYDNRWRGLQTWPKAEGTLIANNVFDANATHVNIGSALTDGYPWYSSNTIARDNIMSNRVTDFRPDKNMSQVQGNYPTGSPTYGNQVFGNCMAPTGDAFAGEGFVRGTNTFANPIYVDRNTKDFRLQSGSPCLGKGPQSIQPASGADLAVVMSATPSAPSVGDPLTFSISVTNKGPLAASGATLTDTVPAGTVLGSVTSTKGTCTTSVSCTIGSLAVNETVTITLVVTPIKAGPIANTASVSSATFDPVAANGTATVSLSASGKDCTKVGTAGNDTLVGTTGNDVLCGLGGDDILDGSTGGDDFLFGGTGLDRAAYTNATNGVVVNLSQKSAWNRFSTGSAGWDQFTSIEDAGGSNFADLFVGDGSSNRLYGFGGNDELYGYGGNDYLFGGEGDDKLDGGTGNDQLMGSNGNDTLNGNTGTDYCSQGTGTGTKTACEN